MKKKLQLITIAGFVLLSACNKTVDTINEPENLANVNQLNLAKIKTGNPYSVKNMQAALTTILKTNSAFSISVNDIKPTHYYVKFYPKDAVEFEKLMDFDNLYFYTFPLDAPQPNVVPELSSKNLVPLFSLLKPIKLY